MVDELLHDDFGTRRWYEDTVGSPHHYAFTKKNTAVTIDRDLNDVTPETVQPRMANTFQAGVGAGKPQSKTTAVSPQGHLLGVRQPKPNQTASEKWGVEDGMRATS